MEITDEAFGIDHFDSVFDYRNFSIVFDAGLFTNASQTIVGGKGGQEKTLLAKPERSLLLVRR
jgi:hypothetical protein